MDERIAVIGLGYAGVAVALAFARTSRQVVGFDSRSERIAELHRSLNGTGEALSNARSLRLTSDSAELKGCTFFIVTVSPQALPGSNAPDLRPLESASRIVGQALSRGAVVVYESTVYPGVTEDVCGPILERESGLRRGVDFKLGYSAERPNPGDAGRAPASVTRIVSGEDSEALDRIASAYGGVIDGGCFRAASIKVAEAAKAIENAQRDLNVALMNELAIIFDRMGLRTIDVLTTAATKWNFLPFRPGLVGTGHGGAGPHSMAAKARQLGYQPEVLLAGRRINNGMGQFVAQKTVKLLLDLDVDLKAARVGVLGLANDEDRGEVQNSRVADIVRELRQFGIDPLVHDPLASPAEAARHLGVRLTSLDEMIGLDALVLAVSHASYVQMVCDRLCGMVRNDGIVVDVESMLDPKDLSRGIHYWSL
jgi:UDP-N-acetyl-D-galactosamine dehydrogenase